jgi:murein DD-endopeptidase MepM/ murein hydrolase activator NlpD
MIRLVPRRSRARVWLVLFVVLLVAVVGGVSYLGWRQSAGRVRVSGQPPKFLGHRTAMTFALDASRGNVRTAEVRVVQGTTPVVVARVDGLSGRHVELPVTVEASARGLREGGATLQVSARDDYWRPIRADDRPLASFPVTIDLTPPKLDVLAATRYLTQGGAGLVVFRVTDAARATVQAGSATFPSFPYGPPERNARVAFMALPWDLPLGTPLSISAEDEAGNTATRGIPGELRPHRFPHDTIELKDPFLQTKVAELLPQRPPTQSLIDAFLVINRDQRRQAEVEKRRIGAITADHPLWEGAFLQPRNTKVFSNFAETRRYIYNGREVDTQVHVGFDLASTRQSPIPAANTGTVAFAGPLTIYGNAVILDHGLGLQTLYAHLSSIDVKVGDAVKKGQELGRSGSTGLAGGDHLHYEVLLHGTPVSAVEWWDAKWIRDRIGQPLREAGLPPMGGLEGTAIADEPSRAPARPVRRRGR